MLWLALACGRPADSDGTTPEDTDPTDDRAAPPEPAEGVERWTTPEVVIPPYSERLYCWLGTFAAQPRALVTFESWQGLAGHHVGFSTTPIPASEVGDGDIVDCTDGRLAHTPIVNPLPVEPHHLRYALPDGMGVLVQPGARWMVQLHYINTTGEPIRVQDVLDLGLESPESVETFAGAFGLPVSEIRVPPGETWSLAADCHMGTDVTALWVAGHMHEHGQHYKLEIARADGSAREALLDLDWTPAMRFEPPMVESEGGLALHEGDAMRVECTWKNDTDAELTFPTEMCGAPGMVYPAEHAVFCQPDW